MACEEQLCVYFGDTLQPAASAFPEWTTIDMRLLLLREGQKVTMCSAIQDYVSMQLLASVETVILLGKGHMFEYILPGHNPGQLRPTNRLGARYIFCSLGLPVHQLLWSLWHQCCRFVPSLTGKVGSKSKTQFGRLCNEEQLLYIIETTVFFFGLVNYEMWSKSNGDETLPKQCTTSQRDTVRSLLYCS